MTEDASKVASKEGLCNGYHNDKNNNGIKNASNNTNENTKSTTSSPSDNNKNTSITNNNENNRTTAKNNNTTNTTTTNNNNGKNTTTTNSSNNTNIPTTTTNSNTTTTNSSNNTNIPTNTNNTTNNNNIPTTTTNSTTTTTNSNTTTTNSNTTTTTNNNTTTTNNNSTIRNYPKGIIRRCSSEGILAKKPSTSANISPQSLYEEDTDNVKNVGWRNNGRNNDNNFKNIGNLDRNNNNNFTSSDPYNNKINNSNNNYYYNSNNYYNKANSDAYKSPYSLSPQSLPESTSHGEMMERLLSLQKTFLNSLASIMEDFVQLSKAEMNKMLAPLATGHDNVRYTGEGVVFHLERKWGIVDLGNHDHVFFDLSILLGSVDDLRNHFEIGERLAFEAVKALKPSRANWKATSIWKLAKPPVFPSNTTPSINLSTHSTTNPSTHNPLAAPQDKPPAKRQVGSCDSTPLLGSWRHRRLTYTESSPVSSASSDPFGRPKRFEGSSNSKPFTTSNYSTTPGIFNYRAAFSKSDFPPLSNLPHLTDHVKLSPCTFMRPPNIHKVNLPTLESDVSVVDEYNSRRLIKKQQQQQLEYQQQMEQKLNHLQQQHDLLKQQLQQQQQPRSPRQDSVSSTLKEEEEEEEEANEICNEVGDGDGGSDGKDSVVKGVSGVGNGSDGAGGSEKESGCTKGGSGETGTNEDLCVRT